MNIIRQLFRLFRLYTEDNVCAVGYWRGRHRWAGWGLVTPARDGRAGLEMRICTRCNLCQTRAALEREP